MAIAHELIDTEEPNRINEEETEFNFTDLPENAIKVTVPHAPVSNMAVQPTGFYISEDGIYYIPAEEDKPYVLVSAELIFITGRYENVTDGTEGLIVSWFQDEKWKKVKLSRDHFMIQSKLVELSSIGFPVSTYNQRMMVKYLAAYERANRIAVPLQKASEQLGWMEEGFLLGNEYIGENKASFIGSDKGEEQFANNYREKGSVHEWIEMIDKVKNFPKVIAGVYASFASPLIHIFDSKTFIFEWSGETSKGKSISQKIAASVWGKPDESGIIKKWRNTQVGLERLAALTNHLPLFLDDTKQANAKTVANSVYNLAGGQGKGRGSTKGMQVTRQWKNIIFSTGEQVITAFSKDGGTAARVIPITGLPFEKADDESFLLVKGIEKDLKNQYGTVGKRFIQFLLDNRDQWENWQAMFDEKDLFYAERAKGNSIASRLAEYFAMIDTASQLFKLCFNLQWSDEPLLMLWDEIISENKEVDRPKQALEDVMSWVYSNENKLFVRNGETIFKPSDCIGKWNEEKDEDLCLYSIKLENFLQSQGYEAGAVVKSWVQRGWLKCDKGRTKKKVSVKGTKEWMYVIKIEEIDSL
ncbi:DUF927 domain-containing protein [Priestia megaterium]|uniref:DUF927 domain-containing protein n=1 Tax=Priestia megaterium TaxID=1404 RepID=UPI002E22E129|nr:DUF927 domain-containing protein [Priestia megaterium]